MTEENKEFVDAYIFMTYENMLKVFENNCLKIIFPEAVSYTHLRAHET